MLASRIKMLATKKFQGIPMRTTIDIDEPILQDLKRLQRAQGKPLGRLVSDLLAVALADLERGQPRAQPFAWVSRSMGARVELADREALWAAMEESRR